MVLIIPVWDYVAVRVSGFGSGCDCDETQQLTAHSSQLAAAQLSFTHKLNRARKGNTVHLGTVVVQVGIQVIVSLIILEETGEQS
jgi:predicted FMN-binding regulatory protein PaiB